MHALIHLFEFPFFILLHTATSPNETNTILRQILKTNDYPLSKDNTSIFVRASYSDVTMEQLSDPFCDKLISPDEAKKNLSKYYDAIIEGSYHDGGP